MSLPRSILRGYDHYTERIVAQALGIPLRKVKKHRKGGEHRHMKIPMSALKKGAASDKGDKSKAKKSKSMKFGAMRAKKAKDDNDGDEY